MHRATRKPQLSCWSCCHCCCSCCLLLTQAGVLWFQLAHRSSLWVSRQAAHGDGRPLQPLFGLGTIVPPQGGVHTTGTTYYSIDCPLGTFVAGFTTTNDQGSVPMVHPWVITSGDGDLIAIAVTSLWPIRCNKGKPAGSNSKLQKLSKSRRLIILSDKRSTGYSGVTLYTGKPVQLA